MPINIITRKFWNQLRNGKTFAVNTGDYTDFSLGTICEKLKTETTIDVFWSSSHAPYYDVFGKSTSGPTVTITRMINSFVTDEFRIGDTIYYDAWFTPLGGATTHYTGTGTIQTVIDLQMDLTSFTGGLPDTSTGNIDSMTIYGTTSLTAVIFEFNFIENSDPNSFISKVDGNTIIFAGSGLTGVDTLLSAQGTIKSWQDKSVVNVKTGSSGVAWKQRFIITHEFWVTPFYIPSQYNDLVDGIAPEYLFDVKSLKYISYYELRSALYNPNIAHSGTDSTQLGDVSWFDEHFNNFTPIEFTKQSIAYDIAGVATSAIEVNETTHVTLEINSANNLFLSGNTNFIVNFFMLPITEAEHKNTLTDMFANYLFDQCFSTIGAVAATGESLTWYGAAMITNCLGTIVTNRLHIEFDIVFSTAQRLLLKDHQYIISVITDDHTTTHATSKRVNVRLDYGDASSATDNPNLLNYARTYTKYWEHPFDPAIAGTGTKNFRGWITDGVYSESTFSIVGGTLNFIKMKVRAYNTVTDENFDLMLFNFDLSPYPVIANERIVSYSTTRGFKLITGSLRNLVSLANIAANEYVLKYAFKIRWEDWVQLLSANTAFYDVTLLNNGLSHKWSNYYGTVAGWVLRIEQFLTIEDTATGDETEFDIISTLNAHDYGEDGNTPPKWTVSIETFEGATSLGVDNAAVFSQTQDTLVVATFTAIDPILTSDLYGILHIEPYQQGGLYGQYEISTVELPVAGCYWKPLTGQTKAKLTIIDAYSCKVEAMIDYTKVSGDISIVPRIGYKCIGIAETRSLETLTLNGLYNDFIFCRSFDLTINGTPIVVGQAIPSPYTLQDVLDQLETSSGGYEWTATYNPSYPTLGTSNCQAPIGNGSSSNGDILIVTFYDNIGGLLHTRTWTLAGGVDEYICPGIVVPSYKLSQETAFYILQENDDFIILDL
jgi:hypothetical protein